MAKTVTLRLDESAYAERRSLANMIETAALAMIRQQQFVDDAEMAEIAANQALLARLQAGSRDARRSRGRFV